MTEPVAPDDTPTRLSEAVVADVIDRLEKHTRALHFQRTTPDNVADLVDAICEHDSQQTADVSRLREERDSHAETVRYLRGELTKAEAEVSRLRDELAARERIIEVYEKQLASAEDMARKRTRS
jgi:cyclopropane fatty-acyl-phospholipid synthase-like methyltransferase